MYFIEFVLRLAYDLNSMVHVVLNEPLVGPEPTFVDGFASYSPTKTS